MKFETAPDETVKINFDDEKTSPGAIIDALERGGFPLEGKPELLKE